MSGRQRYGFTLVVLLVVIAISGLLISILPSAVQAVQDAARRTDNANRGDQSDDLTRQVDDRLLPNGRTISPAGDVLSFPGRPVDLVRSSRSNRLFVKDRDSLRVIDAQDWKLIQQIDSPGGASLIGIAVDHEDRVYFTDSKSGLNVYSTDVKDEDGELYRLEKTIKLPDDSFPCGIKLSADAAIAYVCLSRKNSVAIVDLATGKITGTIDVGVAPFDLIIRDNKLFVSNIGGRRPLENDQTAPSTGTETVVDERGIASTGTVSVVDLDAGRVVHTIPVGLHPTVLAPGLNEKSAVVCNTNEDSISWLDSNGNAPKTVIVKPDAKLPFGSMPSAIHQLHDPNQYAVTLAGNNAVAIFETEKLDGELTVRGLIPTAWYPVAIDRDSKYLFVACTKGLGARALKRPEQEGWNSHDSLGVVQRIPLNALLDIDQMKQWEKQVYENAKIRQVLAAHTAPDGDPQKAPVPVPVKLGDPSHFEHVIYVIKENRTFDQVFGDVQDARSDPGLCVFPEKITPNHHALAKRFGLLDNYYCNGVLSADGHSWATEGNVTPYLERAFGGFARSYTFGDDPITYSSSGFLWDHVLAAGLSFRNYGEMDYATLPDGMNFKQIWDAWENKKPLEFKQNIGIERLRRYSCREYPGWNMLIPDVLRMERFLTEFREFERMGGLPNLIIVYLPQDHLGGSVTSEAHMADNDLAVGQLVEAVSHSKYWNKTLIVVNEDDPQGGYDHIDGHRSLCLVISPFSRPGVNHSFYNQTSALRTMLHVLGLPPMNQQDGSMPLMSDCFRDEADLTPYQAVGPNVPLDSLPKPKTEQSSIERNWREILATVPIQRTGMKTEQDEDNLNRFVWHEVKGWNTPYPVEWTGPHGRGLIPLRLVHEQEIDVGR